MRMKLFEDLGPQTEVDVLKSYQLGEGVMVKFNLRRPETGSLVTTSPEYGFDLYDFEDHFFQSSSGFSTLEDAKWAALAAGLPDQRKAA